MMQLLWKTDGQFLQKLSIGLPADSEILLLVYAQENGKQVFK
jgi:hypothetical protein